MDKAIRTAINYNPYREVVLSLIYMNSRQMECFKSKFTLRKESKDEYEDEYEGNL